MKNKSFNKKAAGFLFFLAFLCGTPLLSAQELRCNFIINDQMVQNKNQQAVSDMQEAFREFMNTTRWTEHEFEEYEKITCTISITLAADSDPSNGSYKATTVQIQSNRPVYGTDYESLVLNTFDNAWNFQYQNTPLTYSENIYNNEITALLSYYAYIIIGLDYDTFKKEGGTPYFEKALAIANNAQQGGKAGWESGRDLRDRYNLVDNLMDPRFLPMREGLYTYHRQTMDKFAESPRNSQENILGILREIEKVFSATQSSLLIKVFFDTKAPELVNIFREAPQEIKEQVVPLMRRMDPTNSNMYNSIFNN